MEHGIKVTRLQNDKNNIRPQCKGIYGKSGAISAEFLSGTRNPESRIQDKTTIPEYRQSCHGISQKNAECRFKVTRLENDKDMIGLQCNLQQ